MTAMETSSTEFEPGPGVWRGLDTAGQGDLKLPAFLHTAGHFGVRVDEARMWWRSYLGRVRPQGSLWREWMGGEGVIGKSRRM